MINLKSLLGKLSIFKDNSALLLPIIIGVVGGLIFVPTQLLSGKIRSRMEAESVATGRKIRSESDRAVSRDQWTVEAKQQELFGKDANQVSLLALQTTKRELLSYKIFPEPNDPSALIFKEFGQGYRSGIEEMLNRLNARERPSDAELERGLQQSLSRSHLGTRFSSPAYSPFSSKIGGYGKYTGMFNEAETAIVDEICLQKAASASVYANPTALSGYDYWGEYKYETGRKEAVEDCWYYQLGYWIIEDVLNTVASMNSGSNSVLTSPAKRIMRVGFTTTDRVYRSFRRSTAMWGGTSRTATGDRPSYVVSLQQGLTEPCTGRYCGEEIDVVHFNVVVVVGSKSVLPFMEELCSGKPHKFRGFWGNEPLRTYKHNQITVLESKIKPVDRQDGIHSLYRYGDEPIAELDLICEYIFNMKAYDPIMPQSVKESFKTAGQKTPGR